MSLLEELNDKRQRVLDDIAIVDQDVETARQTLASAVADRASLDEKLADLDLAILSSSLLFGAAIIACFSPKQGYRK